MCSMRCATCSLTVSGGDHHHIRLINDIRTWVNHVLILHVHAGTSAHHAQVRTCPPCPKCHAVGTWENVVI